MFKNLKIDYILAIAALILLAIGILILTSVSTVTSQENFGRTTYYLFHQIIYGILPGVLLAAVLFFLPIGLLKKWAWIAILANILLMILVFIPGIGVVAGGAPRWLNAGFFTLQPSELLKLSFALYIAAWLSAKGAGKTLKSTLFPFLIIAGIFAILLEGQSDLGTLGVIVSIAGIMYFSANTPLWHAGLMLLLGLGFAGLMIRFSSYRMMRLKVLLGWIEDPMGIGYQIKQILIAIGSGGIFGTGLGMSTQKFGFVPQTMSDAIFSIYAEETGFMGSLILIALLLVVLWRCFAIAKNSDDEFSKLFAIGFGSWICIQGFINIGAMTGIIPLTGIPMPLISYGGSHMIAEIAGLGILLNISKNAKK